MESGAPKSERNCVAFFDVDNTLIRGASLYYIFRGMSKYKFFTRRQIASGIWRNAKYFLTGRELVHDMETATKAGLSFIEGRSEDELTQLSIEVVENILLKKLWNQTVDLAKAHLAQGHEVWLATASPEPVARILAERLGFTGALGTRAETVSGRYTGQLLGVPLHGPAKAAAAKAMLESRKIAPTDCFAYSDSANDLPLLRLVGSPVAINPDLRVLSIAKKENWPIYIHHKLRTRFISRILKALFPSMKEPEAN